MMKKFLYVLTVLLFTIVPLQSQAQLLWKISGKGLTQPSYLFGTHHLAKLSIIDSIEGLKPAFESTKQVIGEIDMKDMMSPSTMALMRKKMMIDNDTTLQMLFTPSDYAKVEKCVQENIPGANMSMFQKIRPAFLTNQLSMLLLMKQIGDFDIQEQLDSYFQKQALAKGKKVAAFETLDQQFDLLFNSTSLRRQAELLLCLIDNIKEESQKALELTAYYDHQKLNEMYKLSQEKEGNRCDDYPDEEARLIYNRNKAWMDKIPAMINENPSFIAVGALHLTGPKGLIALLKKAGYMVTPVK